MVAPVGDAAQNKRFVRQTMSERRLALPAATRMAAAQAVAQQLLGLAEVAGNNQQGRCVAGYSAIGNELDPAAALAGLRPLGCSVGYPRVLPKSAARPRLAFFAAAPAALQPGAFGILEPDHSAPALPLSAIDVFIVPGLAFDEHGARLGYGGGYYDELIAAVRKDRSATFIGLAYDFQIVESCPVESGDCPVDIIITDTRVIRRTTP